MAQYQIGPYKFFDTISATDQGATSGSDGVIDGVLKNNEHVHTAHYGEVKAAVKKLTGQDIDVRNTESVARASRIWADAHAYAKPAPVSPSAKSPLKVVEYGNYRFVDKSKRVAANNGSFVTRKPDGTFDEVFVRKGNHWKKTNWKEVAKHFEQLKLKVDPRSATDLANADRALHAQEIFMSIVGINNPHDIDFNVQQARNALSYLKNNKVVTDAFLKDTIEKGQLTVVAHTSTSHVMAQLNQTFDKKLSQSLITQMDQIEAGLKSEDPSSKQAAYTKLSQLDEKVNEAQIDFSSLAKVQPGLQKRYLQLLTHLTDPQAQVRNERLSKRPTEMPHLSGAPAAFTKNDFRVIYEFGDVRLYDNKKGKHAPDGKVDQVTQQANGKEKKTTIKKAAQELSTKYGIAPQKWEGTELVKAQKAYDVLAQLEAALVKGDVALVSQRLDALKGLRSVVTPAKYDEVEKKALNFIARSVIKNKYLAIVELSRSPDAGERRKGAQQLAGLLTLTKSQPVDPILAKQIEMLAKDFSSGKITTRDEAVDHKIAST